MPRKRSRCRTWLVWARPFVPLRAHVRGAPAERCAAAVLAVARGGGGPAPQPGGAAIGSGILGARVSAAGLGWRAHWMRQQRGAARYNCADSLDRTNVGSFFGAVQVRADMRRMAGDIWACAPGGAGTGEGGVRAAG
jgi:hypothetical protein